MKIGEFALLCRVGSRLCALPLEHVIETMRPLPVEPIGGLAAFVRGVSVIRGAAVPILDLGALLGETNGPAATRVVTVRAGTHCIGIAVEAVFRVFRFPATVAQGLPPLLRDTGSELLTALGTLDAELLTVLATGRLVSDSDWATLSGAT